MDTSSSISILDRVASAARSSVTDTDWNAIAPASTVNFVNVCSDGLCASREAFFFPLLSAASATLGLSASIKLNEFWPEPAILWTAVLADDKCRKTTAVHRFIVTSLKEAMDHLVSEHAHQMFMNSGPEDVIPSSVPTVRPMSDAEFDVDKLASSCREGSREWFLFSRDLRRVYRTLQSATGTNSESDARGHRSERHRDCFYDLQNSGLSPWTDETGAAFSDFRFNLTGFIHPEEAIRLINNNSSSPASHGFLDSTVAIVPGKSGKVYHSKPLGSITATPLLVPILVRLRKEHRLTRVYSLDDEAHSAFASYYNDVEERLDRMSTEDAMWRILSKSQGQVARLALVLHCLDHVTQVVCEQGQIIQKFENRDEIIPERISAGTMYNAINLMRMCIRQKTELINSAALAKEKASDVAASSSGLSSVPDASAKARPVGSPRGVADNTHATPGSESRDRRNSTSSRSSSTEVRMLDQMLAPDAMNMTLQTAMEHRPTTSPQLTPRRVAETTLQTSLASQQPVQPVMLPHSNVQVRHNSAPVVPINIISSAPMAPQPQRFPVAVSVNSGGPKIVHVSYTPQGSSNTVTVQPHATRPNCNLVSLNRISTNVKARSMAPEKRTSVFIPPRAPSRISPAVARALGRKVMKRAPSQPISSLPTSHDFKNFMEICPGKARRILMQGLNSLEAVWVAQRKLIPPIVDVAGGTTGRRSCKYPTNAARALLTAIADAGLGEMVSRSGSRSGKSTFRKRKYENLSSSALETLRKLNITKQQYTHVKNLMYSS